MEKENSDDLTLTEEELNILRDTFYAQAAEMTERLSDDLISLSSGGGDRESIKRIKRFFHTLKGDSSSIGLKNIAEVIHKMEDLMGAVEDGTVAITEEVLDLALKVVDEVSSGIEAHQKGAEYSVPGTLLEKLEKIAGGFENAHIPGAACAGNAKTLYSIRLVFSSDCRTRQAGALLISQLLPQAGDVLSIEPALEVSDAEPPESINIIMASSLGPGELKGFFSIPGVIGEVSVETADNERAGSVPIDAANGRAEEPRSEAPQTIRVLSNRIDQVMDLVGELVMARSMMGQFISRFESRHPKDELLSGLLALNSFIRRSLSDLQRSVMSIRMVPIGRVFKRFPKMVREISRAGGKEIDLVIEGAETEVDKALIDVVGEPLMHLIRNAADHGMELPEQREAAGKKRRGSIKVAACHKDNDIVIKIEDDGRGINTPKLREKALKEGLITAEDALKMDDRDLMRLIFLPRFSTAETVSDISGRGIGMDIVKDVVENMRGSIGVRSRAGQGTVFTLRFPLTLAIMRGIIFRIGDRAYALPMGSIVEIVRTFQKDVGITGGREMLRIRDRIIPLVRMGGPETASRGRNGKMFVLVLNHGETEIGLIVDSLVREEELVVKAVDENWINTCAVCGASILGDGTVVMILNVAAVAAGVLSAAPEDLYKGSQLTGTGP